MPILSRQQIEQYARNAGFTGSGLNTIVAIAFAESGGNTTAYNGSDPYGGSFGLVQINGSHFHSGGTSQACADDPQCAMNYAYMLSRGGTYFLDWGTYTNGSWLHYLQGTGVTGVVGSSNFQGGSGGQSGSGSTTAVGFNPLSPGDWANAIQSAFSNLLKPPSNIPDKQSILSYMTNPVRIIKLSVGGVLVIVSLGLLAYGLGIVDVAVPEYGMIHQAAKQLRKSSPGTARPVRTSKASKPSTARGPKGKVSSPFAANPKDTTKQTVKKLPKKAASATPAEVAKKQTKVANTPSGSNRS